MVLGIEYFDAAGAAALEGVFIPVADLPGVQAAELAAAQSVGAKEGKALLSILNAIYSVLSPEAFIKLGFGVTKDAPVGTDADIFAQTFGASYQKLVNLDTDVISQVPVPTSGVNTGLGDFAIVGIFPGAVKVAAAGAVAGAGIVVQTVSLSNYSSLTHAGLNLAAGTDNRDWFAALLDHLAIDPTVRTAAVASAVTAAVAGNIGSTAIPVDYTQAADPVSGIALADRPRRGLITRTLAYTVEILLNQATQTFDVRVATSA